MNRFAWKYLFHRGIPLVGLVVACFALTESVFAQEIPGGPQLDIAGELEVVILEDFDSQRAERAYFVRERNSHRVFELKFKRPPKHLKSGKQVNVRGRGQGRTLWVEALQEEGDATLPAAQVPGDAALGTDERRAVVLMVDLNDARASDRYTPEQVAANMWTGSRSVDGLFQEASLGQLGFPADSDGDFAPDVFGPFTINYSGTSCDYYDWAVATENAAESAGVDLSLYRHRVFVLPRHNDLPACSWSGIANAGCGSFCRAWIAEGESPMVYAHELGHNLSLAHAGTDPENDGQINSTYGDYSDPMGLSRKWHRFNGAHFDQLGWYAPYSGAVTTVLADGVYDIAPIGQDPAQTGLPHVLKIEKPDSGDFYYLSYRQPDGYDETLAETYTRGINVHRYSGSGYRYTTFVTALNDLEYFDDRPNGITISQVVHNPDYATVQIAFDDAGAGTCTSADPIIDISPADPIVGPGTLVNFTVDITNKDANNCAATGYAAAYSGQAHGSLSAAYLTVDAGQTVSTGLEVDTAGLADGAYMVQVQVTDDDGMEPHHANSVAVSTTIRVDATPPAAPTGLSGTVDKRGKASLNWQPAIDTVAGVASYEVYRDGSLIGQTASTSYLDSNTTAGATHSYTVAAVDGVGNTSAPSNGLSLNMTNTSAKGGGSNGGGTKGGRKK